MHTYSDRCGIQVVLNLCLRTEDTKKLGLDMHVCELQLGLIHMAMLKVKACDALSKYV